MICDAHADEEEEMELRLLDESVYGKRGFWTDDAPAEETRLEEVMNAKGSLVVKDVYPLVERTAYGRVDKKIILDGVIVYDARRPKAVLKGVRAAIGIKDPKVPVYTSRYYSFLDMDEAENLLKALDYMLGLAGRWKTEPGLYREVSFRTKSRFQIGLFPGEKGIEAFARTHDNRRRKANVIILTLDDLREIKDSLDRGVATLKEK